MTHPNFVFIKPKYMCKKFIAYLLDRLERNTKKSTVRKKNTAMRYYKTLKNPGIKAGLRTGRKGQPPKTPRFQ